MDSAMAITTMKMDRAIRREMVMRATDGNKVDSVHGALQIVVSGNT
jgi:hypothetical protein